MWTALFCRILFLGEIPVSKNTVQEGHKEVNDGLSQKSFLFFAKPETGFTDSVRPRSFGGPSDYEKFDQLRPIRLSRLRYVIHRFHCLAEHREKQW